MRTALVGFFGYLLLGALSLGTLLFLAESIQADVERRTQQALNDLGSGWAEVFVDGRDVRIFGTAPSEEAKQAVLAATRGLDGIRKVGGRIKVDTLVSPYVWRVARRGDAITLSGVVPDSATQQKLHDLAQLTFGRPVNDESRIARGVPKGDWTSAAGFAIQQVALMREGEAVLEDTALSLNGKARDVAALDRLEEAASGGLITPFEADFTVLPPPSPEELAAAAAAAVEPAAAAADEEPRVQNASLTLEAPGADPASAPAGLSDDEIDCQVRLDDLLAERSIVFAWGSRKIAPESLPLLEEIAGVLRSCEAARFEIGGHTDSTGKAKANLRLSGVRAESVRELLLASGIAPERLVAQGYGAERPIASNDDEAGRARNRRIEFKLTQD